MPIPCLYDDSEVVCCLWSLSIQSMHAVASKLQRLPAILFECLIYSMSISWCNVLRNTVNISPSPHFKWPCIDFFIFQAFSSIKHSSVSSSPFYFSLMLFQHFCSSTFCLKVHFSCLLFCQTGVYDCVLMSLAQSSKL